MPGQYPLSDRANECGVHQECCPGIQRLREGGPPPFGGIRIVAPGTFRKWEPF